jgi:hypothetical protein
MDAARRPALLQQGYKPGGMVGKPMPTAAIKMTSPIIMIMMHPMIWVVSLAPSGVRTGGNG